MTNYDGYARTVHDHGGFGTDPDARLRQTARSIANRVMNGLTNGRSVSFNPDEVARVNGLPQDDASRLQEFVDAEIRRMRGPSVSEVLRAHSDFRAYGETPAGDQVHGAAHGWRMPTSLHASGGEHQGLPYHQRPVGTLSYDFNGVDQRHISHPTRGTVSARRPGPTFAGETLESQIAERSRSIAHHLTAARSQRDKSAYVRESIADAQELRDSYRALGVPVREVDVSRLYPGSGWPRGQTVPIPADPRDAAAIASLVAESTVTRNGAVLDFGPDAARDRSTIKAGYAAFTQTLAGVAQPGRGQTSGPR